MARATAATGVVAAALVASAATATPARAETALGVDPGYAGAYAPGWPVPVRVQVAADRLVRGRLEVEVGGGVPTNLPVEVPGGSQKQYLLVVAMGGGAQPVEVAARLYEGGEPVATAATVARPAGDQELVGILPGALAGRAVPGPAPLSVDVGTARFAAVGEAELEQAPGSLGPLGTIVVAPDELVRMSPAARQGVLAWVEGGGHLLVDGEPGGSAVAGLPDAWQPGDGRRAAAGGGEVRLTGDAIGAGRWANLVEPTGRAGSRADFGRFGVESMIARSLAGDAGLRVPAVRWLVGFLAVYVVVVGPVLFLVVRRRGRPELAWVAVPLVALLFTTGSYAAGREMRAATELVHASVLNTGRAGSTATTYLGLFSRGGETVRVGLPPGWLAAAPSPGDLPLTRLESVVATADGPDARLPLDAGQFGLVTATGPAEAGGQLDVTATSEADGQARGTVRNNTALTLSDTVVFVGTAGAAVGSLAPGEEREWSVNRMQNAREGPPAEFFLWRGRDAGRHGPGDLALWEGVARDGGPDLRGPGVAVAAGWTGGFEMPVRVGDRSQSPPGDTLVVGRAPVLPEGAPTNLTVRREVVRGSTTGRVGPGSETVVRFVVPGAADRQLFLRPPAGSFDVWVDGGWSPVATDDCQPVPGGPPGRVVCGNRGLAPEVALPAGAAADGVVHVRLRSIPPMALDSESLFTIRTAAP